MNKIDKPFHHKRRQFFSIDKTGSPTISPDGKYVAWLKSTSHGQNMFVQTISDGCISESKELPCLGWQKIHWTFIPGLLLASSDTGGDENWGLDLIDVETAVITKVGIPNSAQSRLHTFSADLPDQVILALNDRDASYHDYYNLDLRTGKFTLVLKNEFWVCVYFDSDLQPRIYETLEEDSSRIFRISPDINLEPWLHIPLEAAVGTRFSAFGKNNRSVYFIDASYSEMASLVEYQIDPQSQVASPTILFTSDKADVQSVTYNPQTKQPDACYSEHSSGTWHVLNKAHTETFNILTADDGAITQVIERTVLDDLWLIARFSANEPDSYWLFDPISHEKSLALRSHEHLNVTTLGFAKCYIVRARDRLPLITQIVFPPDHHLQESAPLPTVLCVHGGPWRRDSWRFDQRKHWLASCGYLVVSTNYRSSIGLGRTLLNAGRKQWGRSMQDDLVDVLDWAIDAGYSDPTRVAIMGGSYGGYAALHAVATLPDRFACAVALSPISDLISFFRSIPIYWNPVRAMLCQFIGDPDDPDDADNMKQHSPLSFIENINCPILIGHGKNDPRVNVNEAVQIHHALSRRGKSSRLSLFSDEGHGLSKPRNLLAFYTVAEQFLSEHLEGHCEFSDTDISGSSIRSFDSATM